MIYAVASIILETDKAQQFSDIMEREYLPAAEKHGVKMVACLKTALGGNVDEVTDIWAFQSLEHLEKVRASQFKDVKYMDARKKLRDLMKEETIKIMVPLPVSPLK